MKKEYRDDEQRYTVMIMAATSEDPEIYGDMDEAEKQEYNGIVKWMKQLPPDAEIDISCSMD